MMNMMECESLLEKIGFVRTERICSLPYYMILLIDDERYDQSYAPVFQCHTTPATTPSYEFSKNTVLFCQNLKFCERRKG